MIFAYLQEKNIRKIIILNWALKIFMGVQIIAIPFWEYTRYNLITEQIAWMYKDSIFGNFSHYIMLVRVTVLISGIVYIQKGLQAFIKEGFFNFKSSKRFKTGGYLLSITSVFSIIVSLLNMKKSIKGEFSNIIMDLLLLASGIGLLAFSDVIKKGNIIETENNLTIYLCRL